MENDSGKELSSLRLSRLDCPKCGAVWINGQHMWATGAKGNEIDLASLVCNKLGDANCINPCKGKEGGDTWEKRLSDLHRLEDEARDDGKL